MHWSLIWVNSTLLFVSPILTYSLFTNSCHLAFFNHHLVPAMKSGLNPMTLWWGGGGMSWSLYTSSVCNICWGHCFSLTPKLIFVMEMQCEIWGSNGGTKYMVLWMWHRSGGRLGQTEWHHRIFEMLCEIWGSNGGTKCMVLWIWHRSGGRLGPTAWHHCMFEMLCVVSAIRT